jgi:hypothetical protein
MAGQAINELMISYDFDKVTTVVKDIAASAAQC